MKRSSGIPVLVLAMSLFFFSQCNWKKDKLAVIEPVFHPEISAFTAGVISGGSVITIELANDIEGPYELMVPVEERLFDFSPNIRGTAYRVGARTIEFRPEKRLANGQVYNVRFHVGRVREVPRDMARFDFSFQVIAQSFALQTDGMDAIDPDDGVWNRYHGMIVTSDYMDEADVARLIKAWQGQRSLTVRWEQNAQATRHSFTIDSLQRSQDREHLRLVWDGKPLGINIMDERIVGIPALGDFSVMEAVVVQQPEQHVVVRFSDPLTRNQNLRGLVVLDGTTHPRYMIDGNRLLVYPPARLTGDYALTIHEGLTSRTGYRFAERKTFNLSFEDNKPAVRLSGSGVILPDSDGLIFPFEAVNLRAVDLRIIKIFENNVGQFLQVNRLGGQQELKRAGRLVLQRTVALTSERPVDYGRWNSFSFDLSTLIRAEPGAIYRVEIGFRQEHARYPCGDEESSGHLTPMQQLPDDLDEAMAYWDNPDMYWDPYSSSDWYYWYEWEERDNPCHKAYYGQHRTVGRNVLASNLGIIAKGGSDHSMVFAVTDLRTTAPLANVDLDIYNYQNQLIGSVRSGSDGLARIRADMKPYLLVARLDSQRGYLRLDDGTSLSLSRFDTGGAELQKGIKGFIYTDRGVWRPGDSLFVMFMLEDRQKQLPQGHPVVFELYDPAGQLVQRQSRTGGVNGFYNFSTFTSSDAPTGNWRAAVRVGGSSFSRVLKVETVKPNRLKIDLNFGATMLGVHQAEVQGRLHVAWLHGAPARNLRARVTVMLRPVNTTFPSHEKYHFDDPSRSIDSDEVTVFDDRLDAAGNAVVRPRIAAGEAAPGMLQAHFVVRAFEQGGDFSTDRFSMPYSPYKTYVGIKAPEGEQSGGMLYNDTDHRVEVVTVNSDGRPVSVGRLDVQVYRLEWRWWWDASGEGLASYMGSSYPSPVHTQRISTDNGRGSFVFRIPHPDWGRYLIRVSDPDGGHSTGQLVYVDWPGWASRGAGGDPEAAAMLSISTDKQTYMAGDQVHVSLPAVKQGRAFVSLESGSRVLRSWWQEARDGELRFSFPATAEMTPNGYLHVSLLQPHARAINDLPIRMYGVVPLFVEDPGTKLRPVIDMPASIVPEQQTTIKVKEADGKRMTYTLALVDEGLLDLTRFRTPDPWNTFYAREALGVKTWDVYDDVLGAYGGRLEQVFSIGGDEDIQLHMQPQANRFKPVVRFSGPHTLDRRKTASHVIDMPPYIGSVRVMVVAGDDGAYGHAEKTVAVKKPLMVLATLPRVLSPGEKVSLPVTIFAMDEKARDVRVEVTANELFGFPEGRTRQLVFAEAGEQVISFPVEVVDATGTGRVKVEVTGGQERAAYEIEIAVRNPNPRIFSVTEGMLEAGQAWSATYAPVGVAGTNTAVLELSTLPPMDFGRRLKYLIGYPHGCLEQVASSAFPQLYLGQVMEMDDNMRSHTDSNIREAIRLIASYQRPDGGLRYWPGGSDVSDWGTSYAGHFMVEAALKGFALPVRFREGWISYQAQRAGSWVAEQPQSRFGTDGQGDLLQAYRLYTLALANAPELGAMNRLREHGALSQQARWRLAAAYALAGQPEAAHRLIDGMPWQVESYPAFNASYGSAERDMAMIVEALLAMDRRAEAIPIIIKLSEALTAQRWMSTQTTAYCLMAVSKFAGSGTDGGAIRATYRINEGREMAAATARPLYQADVSTMADREGSISVTNNGSGVLFARLIADGIPALEAVGAAENQLRVAVNYLDMSGNTLDVGRLEQGTDFMAEVVVNNPGRLGNYSDMVLTQLFPSGWEIRNVRMDEVVSLRQGSVPTYQDIRDDRVHTHFDIRSGETKKFIVMLHAAYLGRTYLPGTFCEAMYNDAIHARLPGRWVEVVMPGRLSGE